MRAGPPAATVLLPLLALGCSGDDPTGLGTSANRGGTGNQTLLVQATVAVNEVVGGFLSEFRISVLDRVGEPVSGATATIASGFGQQQLLESELGEYRGELIGAAWGTLALDVGKDSLYVRDVILGNIGVHAFITPEANDTVDAGAPLPVRWQRDSDAPFARLTTRDFSWDNLPDRGEFVIPDSMNPARLDQRIELLRYNEVQIAGGLRGSFFRMEVRTSIQPVVVTETGGASQP